MTKPKFGEYLINKGVLNLETLGNALSGQKVTQDKLGQSLVKQGFIRAERLNSLLSEYFGMEYLSLFDFQVDASAVTLIPQYIARKLKILPVKLAGNRLTIAIAEPLANQVNENLKRITGKEIDCVFMEEQDLVKAFDFAYINGGDVIENSEFSVMQRSNQNMDAIKLVDKILENGFALDASDVHIEPEEDHLRIRYRIDGVLKTVEMMPARLTSSIISRIKVLAGMNITEKRSAQDGSFKFEEHSKSNKFVSIRVSTIPSLYGEKAVLRLQYMGRYGDLKKIGLEVSQLDKIYSVLAKNHGIFLTTGPSGSGKTTTLYASLNHLHSDGLNIITVEDPIEFPLKRVIQTEADQKFGFQTALRSILRQDPDVIMVGEIRDGETAKLALQAALTGHLVLSTLHTNDATSAVSQFIEMGCERFLVNAAVNAVLAQRLVRVLCSDCKKPYVPEENELIALGLDPTSKETFYTSEGCPTCRGLKYRGRTGIYELLVLDKGFKQLLSEHASQQVLRDYAIKNGMDTLRQDGINKMRKGITSFAEVILATSNE